MLLLMMLGCATRALYPLHAADAHDVVSAIEEMDRGLAVRAVHADARTQAVVVLATEPGQAWVGDLIENLDVSIEDPSPQIHVYYLIHQRAELLIPVLRDALADVPVRLAADPTTNCIVVHGAVSEARLVERLVAALDTEAP